MPPTNPNARADFVRRLAYFLIGTAIGLFILGVISEQRKRARAGSPQSVPATPPPPGTP